MIATVADPEVFWNALPAEQKRILLLGASLFHKMGQAVRAKGGSGMVRRMLAMAAVRDAIDRLTPTAALLREAGYDVNLGPLPERGSARTKGATIARSIILSLTADLEAGLFQPGARLTESMLCDRYRCSRTPIREALATVAALGLVELRPNRGAVVPDVKEV